MTDRRRSLLDKIETCARLTGSDKVHEALSAADKAFGLIYRYEIDPRELSRGARCALEPFACAGWLRVNGRLTRWAAEVGESTSDWHVTGLGVVDAATMLAHAEARGYRRRFGQDT